MHFFTNGTLLAFINILILSGCIIFAIGFFPYKPVLPGLATWHNGPPSTIAPFDRVVFMVVDALRSDFVFGNASSFKFTQGLINTGEAIPFTSHASAPTVTMPRVKAITTGSIPSFLDLILNFAESDTTSTLAHQDSWLAQLKKREGGKIIMYGDDTWLKLFPDTFDRADGTTSFFVSDYIEVDNNVTRHIPHELEQNDWNAMILHYLGMDHIGHKAGAASPNMPSKQKEMDDTVRMIYEAIRTSEHLHSTLLVLCGDHGMTDAGNHGGSASGETSPALAFISPKFTTISSGYRSPVQASGDHHYYDKVDQADIAPTLAGLLDFPIPKNNLGVFIPQLLPLISTDRQLHLMKENAHQMLTIVKAGFPHPLYEDSMTFMNCNDSLSSTNELACAWFDVLNSVKSVERSESDTKHTVTMLQKFCYKAQKLLSSAASNYDVTKLGLGTFVTSSATVLAIVSYAYLYTGSASILHRSSFPDFKFGDRCVILSSAILYGAMMFASSYVEEEQNFWYWISTAWLSLILVRRKIKLPTALFAQAVMRLMTRWNQSGQKFVGASDVVAVLVADPSTLLWPSVLLTFAVINGSFLIKYRKSSYGYLVAFLVFTTQSLVVLFKINFIAADDPELLPSWIGPALIQISDNPVQDLVWSARAAFVLIACGFAALTTGQKALSSGAHKMVGNDPRRLSWLFQIHYYLTLLLIMQTRVTNIPLFLAFQILHNFLQDSDLSWSAISTVTLFFAHASFFAMGGTNSISSVDLSNAYNGISGYNAVMVGILIFMGNWAGPIWWSVTGLQLIAEKCHRVGEDRAESFEQTLFRRWKQHITLLTCWIAFAAASVMAACAFLRTHLFVWTVFSPKFLYMIAWTFGWHILVNCLLGYAILSTY